MEGFWPIFFLLVVLKIPVFGALWLVWWASREPEPEAAEDDSGNGFNRWRPMPKRPRGPHNLPGGASAMGRSRGASPAQRRPVFRPTGNLGRPAHSAGEKPSKQERHPGSFPKPPA